MSLESYLEDGSGSARDAGVPSSIITLVLEQKI